MPRLPPPDILDFPLIKESVMDILLINTHQAEVSATATLRGLSE